VVDISPRKNANFGRFEVAFDRPEFDRTQVLVYYYYYYYFLIPYVSMFPREFKNWKYKMQNASRYYYYYYYYYFIRQV